MISNIFPPLENEYNTGSLDVNGNHGINQFNLQYFHKKLRLLVILYKSFQNSQLAHS